ncbi:MAG TPA: CRISPR-associated endonuclease Cas2 [Candidatus Paceibacterota bacterium]|nr:CRISPR-associated endonuclease Cas2 [Candidatus Paceibacterota bacterium]
MDIEKRVKTRARRQRIQHIVLGSVYAATAIGMAMVAPNSVQLLRHVQKHFGPKEKLGRRISQAITRLHSKGLVVRVKTEKGFSLKLTEKGNRLAESLEARESTHAHTPKRWDGKWRIVIFDVWERRRGVRDQLRHMLQKAGFVKIQNSVWVYPYDCEELFTFLRIDLHLGKGILYIVAEEIEHDEKLRQHFHLPRP